MIKKAFYISMLALLTVACTSIDCPVQNTVYTAYHIYDTDGNRISLGDMLSVTTTRRDGTDSVLLNRMTGNSEFELPISYNDPEDTLFFEISRMAPTEEATEEVLVRDTVWVAKDNYPHFESVDCNASFFHTITAVKWTRNIIDSIAINNKSVTYDASKEHFHIYLKVRN